MAATCAAAGIIVAVVTLTGLGLNLSGIIIDVAGGSLLLCALLAAVAVLLLGLAVPVTASFIIAAVIVSPALTKLGVEPLAAYMFIFYYAVLSEVSPPTALVGVRRRGDHRRQRVPHDDADLEVHAAGVPRPVRVRAHRQRRGPAAAGLGRHGPARVRGLRARGGGARGGDRRRGCSAPRGLPERVLCGAAGIVLLYLEPLWIAIGLGLLVLGVVVHLVGRRQVPSGLRSAEG